MKSAGDPTYLVKACKDGYFNGCVPGKNGPEMPQSGAVKNRGDLDKARYGSKAGVLKKGKAG